MNAERNKGALPKADAGPRAAIAAKAQALGFDAIAIARADEPLGVDYGRYLDFLQRGHHGRMGYLAADPSARERLDGEAILPGAKSVICLARRYGRGAEAEASDPPLAKLFARYARGQDYHNFLRKKLRALAKFVRGLGPGIAARPLLDEEPLLERAWAARAGLGFIGKNGLLIVPGKGSLLLLGEVVTTLELPVEHAIKERCGSCTLCLDACPTQAFEAPFVLNATRCISYLTIEDRQGAREGIGEHLFGCDDCQTVCPFNRTAPPEASTTRPFEPLQRWRDTTLEQLAELDDAGFSRLAEGSPVHRATRAGLARSAVALLEQRRAEPATSTKGRRVASKPGLP